VRAFGVHNAYPKYETFGFCGTDEPPTISVEEEMEAHKEGGVQREEGFEEHKFGLGSIETIPTAEEAIAILVHLPEGCVAQSTVPAAAGKKAILGRLALDGNTVAEIFQGWIKNWKQVEEAQADDAAKITCRGGTAEEETPISVVVRADRSGPTHIFKSWLAQVSRAHWLAEEFGWIKEGEGHFGEESEPCGEVLEENVVTWNAVQEGCENQRWPSGAKVVRPGRGSSGVGDGPLMREVERNPSSITYAGLASARRFYAFSGPESPKGSMDGGGENRKGTESKVGEQRTRFWAEIQNSVNPETYTDPASNGDVGKAANANCAGTRFLGEGSETFPPKTTRNTWFAVKASSVETKYAICGLTYELALRVYKPYLRPKSVPEEEGVKSEATTVENFLFWAINGKAQGGAAVLKNHDYEKLPPELAKKAERGVQEIGYAVP
jgi:ABC-type phosphate transport system substrate-binding protein